MLDPDPVEVLMLTPMTTNRDHMTLIDELLEQIREHPHENLDQHAARITPPPTEDEIDDAAGYLLLEGFVTCTTPPPTAPSPMLLFAPYELELTLAHLTGDET